MTRDIHATLASQFDSHSIVRQLHDVPPHEVYEITVDGRRAVLKRDTGPTGKAGIEGRMTRLVGDRTSVPVPEVLRVGDDHYVAAWHPEAPASDERGDVTELWAVAAGRGLATLHDETDSFVESYGQFRPDDGFEVTGFGDWHAAAVAHVRRLRSVLDRYGHADVADAVVDFLRNHPDVFDGVGSPVCCHGWATPAHVAVRAGRVTCVLDFEHVMAAPGEFDYWRTVLPTFSPDTDASVDAFRDGYESVRPLPAGFERRKPLYVTLNELYYLVSLYVQNRHGSDETAERAQWFRNHIFERLERVSEDTA